MGESMQENLTTNVDDVVKVIEMPPTNSSKKGLIATFVTVAVGLATAYVIKKKRKSKAEDEEVVVVYEDELEDEEFYEGE